MPLDQITPDRFQQLVLNLSAERTMVIKGVAGSGKSVMLLKKAKQVAASGQALAIIVYTKALRKFFATELAEIGAATVYHFNEWESLAVKPFYEYMFVDECQDFSAAEIEDFRNHSLYLWLFGDSDQSIMGFRNDVQTVEATAAQLGVRAQDLGLNHRLTRENALVGEYIRPKTRLSYASTRRGERPVLANKIDQIRYIADTIRNRHLTNVGILVYYNAQVRAIAREFAQMGLPVQTQTADSLDIDFTSDIPKVMTWHTAKGLQFDNVFVPFCGTGDYKTIAAHWPYDPMIEHTDALYVAVTRPFSRLYLIHTLSPAVAIPPVDSDIYFGNGGENEGPF